MSPGDALKYDDFWRKNGIGSNETWDGFKTANSNSTIDDYFKLVNGQSPWLDGYTPQSVTLNSGDSFEMALSKGQPPTLPGRFGTTPNSITDVNYVRNDLAVKAEWKSTIDRVATYQVKDGITVPGLQGPIGPQIDLGTNTYLPGGPNQVNLLLDRGANAMDYFDIISIRGIK